MKKIYRNRSKGWFFSARKGKKMAKNDFSVIACIILSYLYESIKRGESANPDYLTNEFFHTNEVYFDFILGELYKKGYIDGCKVIETKDSSCLFLYEDFHITMAGIEYLGNNESMNKAKAFISGAHGWIDSLLTVLQLGTLFGIK